MTEYRKFPVGLKGDYTMIPIGKDGTPKRKSPAWRNMIADAVARAPEQRSPAEINAIRQEINDNA